MGYRSTFKGIILLALFLLNLNASFAWTTPTMSSPSTGSSTTGGVTIDWNAVTGSTAYQYQYDTISGFSSPVKVQGTLTYINSSSGNTDTQFTIANNFFYGKTYYWRVRAYVSGDTSSWSATWTFITPTFGPSMVTPSTGTTGVKAGVTLDWNSHYYVVAYDWQADTVPTFSSAAKKQGSNTYINTSSGNTDTQVTLSDLFYGTTYYWRVRSRTTVDTSAWTTAWTFTVTATGPALLSPSTGTTNVKAGLTLDWDSHYYVTAYDWQLDTVATFTSTAKRQGNTTYINTSNGNNDTQVTLGDLYYGKTYYWRVRSRNNVDTSAWTTAWTFTVTAAGPALLSPSTGTTNVKAGLTLDWDSHYYITAYDWQLDTVATFTSTAKRQGNTTYINTSNGNNDTQVTLGDLYYGKTYYWRVRSRNNVDTSAWTTAWTFTVTATGPALLSPSTGTTNVKAGLTLDWDSHYYVTAYDWQLDTVATFTSTAKRQGNTTYINTSNGNNDTQVTLGDLYYGKTYYWRVRSRNNVDTSEWTTPWTYTVTLYGPTLYSPTNGQINVSTSGVTLDWDSHYYVLKYQVESDTTPHFNSTLLVHSDKTYINTSGSNTDTQSSLTSLLSNTVYYWRVRSMNNVDTSEWTPVWAFNTGSAPAIAPTLISPSNYATNIAVAGTTLQWSTVVNATQYIYQFDDNSQFTSPASNTQTSLTLSTGSLLSSTTYYWRVRAANSSGNSPWSATWQFTTLCNASIPQCSGTSVCDSGSVTLNATGSTAYNWYDTSTGGNLIGSSSGFTTPLIHATDTFYVAGTDGSCESNRTMVIVIVLPSPSTPVITVNGSSLQSTPGNSYQWFLNGNLISSGGTSQNYTPLANGNYTVRVTNSNGCSSLSQPFNYIWVGIAENAADNSLEIYPNPASGQLNIDVAQKSDIEILNIEGQIINSINVVQNHAIVDVSGIANGLYIVRISNSNGIAQKMFVKE